MSDIYSLKVENLKLKKHLNACSWALEILNDAFIEKNILTTEKSQVKAPKIKIFSKEKDIAKDLQQWYTIDELASECMDKFIENCSEVWLNPNTVYLEPSAGEGDILRKLPKGRSFGVDLDPQHRDVVKLDFFDTSREWLNRRAEELNYEIKVDENTPLVLIGNPPFGDVALQFFNHATKILEPEYIAWILPNSFLTRKKRDKIDPYYHLIYVMNITCCYVHKGKLYNLPTMFGIWKKKNIPIKIPLVILDSPDFELILNKIQKDAIYQQEIKGELEPNIYIWMRKVIQHIKTIPQKPVFKTVKAYLDSYKNVRMRDTPYQRLLSGFCIKCAKGKYDQVFNHFGDYQWKQMIGQYGSARATKDWTLSSRITISKRNLYGAYNNDIVFNPYIETIDQALIVIKHEKSNILRGDIENEYKKGGKRKKKTRKNKQRKTKRK